MILEAGSLGTSTWSKGFVASAESLAQDFVSVRSLVPIRAVVLGPPGGDQHSVCEEVRSKQTVFAECKVFITPEPGPFPPKDRGKPALWESLTSNELYTIQVSRRHGIARVDAKIAMDAVFVALGKPLPEPLPPEDKVPTPAKAKKGKESKKGGITRPPNNAQSS